MNTPEGAKVAKKTMISKFGGIKAYRAFMAEIGRRGGQARVKKGFATDHARAVAAGKKSKRGKSKDIFDDIDVSVLE